MYANYERRERPYNREEEEAMHLLDLKDMREGEYQRAINEACHAIRMIPMDALTHEVISQLLNTISCAATTARLDAAAELLDACSNEVECCS
jgi:hypothetical protein